MAEKLTYIESKDGITTNTDSGEIGIFKGKVNHIFPAASRNHIVKEVFEVCVAAAEKIRPSSI